MNRNRTRATAQRRYAKSYAKSYKKGNEKSTAKNVRPIVNNTKANSSLSLARQPVPAGRSQAVMPSVPAALAANTKPTPILRRELGEVLRQVRLSKGCTLRQVSAQARVSLGYLSEVERGQKEASSELLAAICQALDAPLSLVLREVSERIAVMEGLQIPESVPADLLASPALA